MSHVLETARLRLREVTHADLDFLAKLHADPEGMRYFPKLLSRDESVEWIDRQLRRYATNGHGMWLVEERATNRPVGRMGLAMQEVDGVWEPEIGYMIDKAFWRQGFATEAALAVRGLAFDRRKLETRSRKTPAPGQGRRSPRRNPLGHLDPPLLQRTRFRR